MKISSICKDYGVIGSFIFIHTGEVWLLVISYVAIGDFSSFRGANWRNKIINELMEEIERVLVVIVFVNPFISDRFSVVVVMAGLSVSVSFKAIMDSII